MATTKPAQITESTPTIVTATELAKNLSDILNRVKYKGEHFEVRRNGEVIARIDPPPAEKVVTFGDFLDFLRHGPRPDDQFADDLEAVLAELPKIDWADYPEWPD